MVDRERGIYEKFKVERTDGSSAPGGKHEKCFYFVLDTVHDPFAITALQAYARVCRKDYPLLANDIESLLEAGRPIVMSPVASSNVNSVGYDAGSKVLRVKFNSGGLYEYMGVPPEAYSELMGAESVGRFLNQQIKPMYEVRSL